MQNKYFTEEEMWNLMNHLLATLDRNFGLKYSVNLLHSAGFTKGQIMELGYDDETLFEDWGEY